MLTDVNIANCGPLLPRIPHGLFENERFWREFLTDLTDRGLVGVRLVISDAHAVEAARTQHRAVVDELEPYAPTVAGRLQAMETDPLAYTSFPTGHWSKIWSNNPIERLNCELKRRTDVVGIFPDNASVIRLIGALLAEINDEMIAAERRYIAAASVAELVDNTDELALPAAPRT